MAELVLHDVDEGMLQRLILRAQVHGLSAEEEHRRILRSALAMDNELENAKKLRYTITHGADAGPEYDHVFERKDEYMPDRELF